MTVRSLSIASQIASMDPIALDESLRGLRDLAESAACAALALERAVAIARRQPVTRLRAGDNLTPPDLPR